MDIRNRLDWLLDPWVLIGAVGFGLALTLATLFLLWATRKAPVTPGLATAMITVVELPTETLPIPTATPGTPTPSPVPLVDSGEISLEAYVEIAGTGGEGLRFRVQPNLQSQVLFLGVDSEVFQVTDGPQEADGHTWWYLVAPFDETRKGWAVSDYLAVVQNP